MRYPAQLAIVVVSVGLAACGSTDPGQKEASTAPADAGAAGAVGATTSPTATGAVKATGGKASASASSPCGLVSSQDVKSALGVAAKGVVSEGDCHFNAGTKQISIDAAPSSSDRATTARLVRDRPPRAKVVHGPDYTVVVSNIVEPGTGAGAQAGAAFSKGGTEVHIIVSDAAKAAHSLSGAAARLAAAVARRL